MTTPLADRLRREATLLRATARNTWLLGEDLIEAATRQNQEADRLEQEASDVEELARAEPWIGSAVKPRKERAA